MGNNFAGIEFFNTKMTDDEVLNDDVLEMFSEQVSADIEIVTAMEEVEEIMDGLESFEASMNDLERLHDIIARDGISKGLMEFADPDGFLVEQIDGFPAVESLDVTPTLDSNAVAAMEGFKETMKKWGDSIKKFFKGLMDRIKKIIAAVVRAFSSYEKTLKKLAAKVKDANDVDPDEAKKKEINMVPPDSLKALIDAIDKATQSSSDLSKVETFIKDTTSLKALGLKVETGKKDSDTKLVKEENEDLKSKKDTVAGFKLDKKWAEENVKEAIDVVAAMRQIPKAEKALQANQQSVETALKSLEKAEGKDKEEIDKMKEEVKQTLAQTRMAVTVLNASVKASRTYVSNVITGANAVISVAKKK